jgi:hypothetical protein
MTVMRCKFKKGKEKILDGSRISIFLLWEVQIGGKGFHEINPSKNPVISDLTSDTS